MARYQKGVDKAPLNGTPSFWLRCFIWALRVLGIPQRHCDVLEDSAAGRSAVFQAFALVVSSFAFAVTTFLFSYVLIGNALLLSIGLAAFSGFSLFALDRMTLGDKRQDPSVGRGMAWTVRLGTVAMALMMAILQGVASHKEDIERIQSANATADATARLQSPDAMVRTEVARAALRQAEADAKRRSELRHALTQAQDEVAKAESELARELNGAFDPTTGVKRQEGRGPKARHWEAVVAQARQHASALQAELLALGDIDSRSAKAEVALKAMQDEALSRGRAAQQGPAKRIEALFELLRSEWTAWFSLGYGIALALLPEILLLRAMARQPALDEVYAGLRPLERRRTEALIGQAAIQMKADIAARAKRMKAANRAASHASSASKPGGGQPPGFGFGTASA